MKNLQVLTTAFLVTFALSGYATAISEVNTSGASIISPAIIWGDPSDVNSESVEALRTAKVEFPTNIWGDPNDIISKTVESLKSTIANPGINWGSAEDVNSSTVQALKTLSIVEAPATEWGDSNDINLFTITLKTLQQ